MKVLAVVLSLAVATSFARQVPAEENTAYGYLQKIGIPEAERIRKAEEELLSNPSKVVGGVPSVIGQFPWQAGLISGIIGLEANGICGGSLVSPNRVITAAHCWYDGSNQAYIFTIVLGSTTLFSGGTRITSSAVVTHPSWFPLLVRNDVAVIYLPSNLEPSAVIRPISLPSGPQMLELFTGESAVIAGYGTTSDDVGISINQILSYVNVNVISNTVCRFSFPLYLSDDNICSSGAGGVGPCGGDTGGALYITRDGQQIMIGVLSFVSSNGCQSGAPAVYARTTDFMDFFQSHLN